MSVILLPGQLDPIPVNE